MYCTTIKVTCDAALIRAPYMACVDLCRCDIHLTKLMQIALFPLKCVWNKFCSAGSVTHDVALLPGV